MSIYEALISPFADYGFMRRALAACVAMAVSSAPLGVFLVLRRMTLIGEASAHAILPGVAIAFFVSGLALLPMTLGGLIAGLLMAMVAGGITRLTNIKEDASFTAAYLTSMAFGVMIISMNGSAVDVLHLLFGNVLAVDGDALVFINSIASFSLLLLATIYRPLIIECFDPNFLKVQRGKGAIYHQIFLFLVILNLLASFQVLGTLMAVGMMILPAITSHFWTKKIDLAIGVAVLFAVFSAISGLLISYHYSLPSGSTIILSASACYIFSVLFGTNGSIFLKFFPRKHFHEKD